MMAKGVNVNRKWHKKNTMERTERSIPTDTCSRVPDLQGVEYNVCNVDQWKSRLSKWRAFVASANEAWVIHVSSAVGVGAR